MLTLNLALLATAALANALPDNPQYHPHGAFALIRTGERTPLLRGPQTLTALGAQQMVTLGENMRARYLSADGNAGLGRQNMANVSADVVDSSKISVQTLDMPHLVSAAQAFMQGLYPPRSAANSSSPSGESDAAGRLADGSTVDYPLDGYQYARVQTFDSDAYQSMYLTAQQCPVSKVESLKYLTSPGFVTTKADSDAMYQKLDTEWFEGHLTEDKLDYLYAMEVNDYLSYQYTHNKTVHDKLNNDDAYAGVYNRTRELADEYAWNFWGGTNAASNDTDMQAIAGKTLAAKILGSFQKLIKEKKDENDTNESDLKGDGDDATSGAVVDDGSHPLTFIFGETGPFVSLASLMLLDEQNAHFRAAAPYASAMVFELYSVGADSAMPTNPEDLWVRFYFHNGTEPFAGQMMAFSMFNRPHSQFNMAWPDFQDAFSRIMINSPADWCAACASPSLFCGGVEAKNIMLVAPPRRQQKKAMSPVVAGVIGAIVSLAVAGLLFGLAVLLGGVRFQRVQRRRSSGLGGFKGTAKMASDADLGIKNQGAAPAGVVVGKGHERSGSWELRQKEFGGASGDMGEEGMPGRDSLDGAAVQPHWRV